LAGIGSAGLLSAADKAKTATETAAARTLISAYQAAAADNGGRYLAARDTSAVNVLNGEGKPVSNRQVRARYPFRLAPYFNYAIESTLLAGDNRQQLLKVMNLSSPSGSMYDYGVSAFPSFGINRYLSAARPARPTATVSIRSDRPIAPSLLLSLRAAVKSMATNTCGHPANPAAAGAGESGLRIRTLPNSASSIRATAGKRLPLSWMAPPD
jgi:hypothetical protein